MMTTVERLQVNLGTRSTRLDGLSKIFPAITELVAVTDYMMPLDLSFLLEPAVTLQRLELNSEWKDDADKELAPLRHLVGLRRLSVSRVRSGPVTILKNFEHLTNLEDLEYTG